ncbi:hypothetical protein CDO44_08255 [Pigmentiphaga sp. NML080357]|nr:hypothetical protein CDO44_08255 [Pigmentiphaga sp. NML080357]
MGCAMHGPDQAGAAARQDECVTNRDVREVVVRLRDMGWTAQRTIDEVLATSQIDDVETKNWFVGLVTDIYGNRTTLAQVDADYAACMKSLPANVAPVLSASSRAEVRGRPPG